MPALSNTTKDLCGIRALNLRQVQCPYPLGYGCSQCYLYFLFQKCSKQHCIFWYYSSKTGVVAFNSIFLLCIVLRLGCEVVFLLRLFWDQVFPYPRGLQSLNLPIPNVYKVSGLSLVVLMFVHLIIFLPPQMLLWDLNPKH